MKLPAMLLSVLFLLSANYSVLAQADCGYWVRIQVRDQADARLKLSNGTEFYYRENLSGFEAFGLLGVGAPARKAELKVKAKGFKPFTEELGVSCATFHFILRLSPKGSKAPAVFEQITQKVRVNEK